MLVASRAVAFSSSAADENNLAPDWPVGFRWPGGGQECDLVLLCYCFCLSPSFCLKMDVFLPTAGAEPEGGLRPSGAESAPAGPAASGSGPRTERSRGLRVAGRAEGLPWPSRHLRLPRAGPGLLRMCGSYVNRQPLPAPHPVATGHPPPAPRALCIFPPNVTLWGICLTLLHLGFFFLFVS